MRQYRGCRHQRYSLGLRHNPKKPQIFPPFPPFPPCFRFSGFDFARTKTKRRGLSPRRFVFPLPTSLVMVIVIVGVFAATTAVAVFVAATAGVRLRARRRSAM